MNKSTVNDLPLTSLTEYYLFMVIRSLLFVKEQPQQLETNN